MTTIRDFLYHAQGRLAAAGLPSPRLDAELIVAHSLGMDRTYLYAHPERVLTEKEHAAASAMVGRRLLGEPVAYITGWKEFWSLRLRVDRRVLIPRPETEHLVEEALKALKRPRDFRGRVLDVGTGSGAIALALAGELPEALVVASDISWDAITVAAANARRLGLAERVVFVVGDLLAPFAGPFAVVVTNPPYIPDAVYETLPAGVRMYEPGLALRGGNDGMDFYRALIPAAARSMESGGILLMEIDAAQARAVFEMVRREGSYEGVRIVADYAGRDRVVQARRV